MAAVNTAKRVAEERGTHLGKEVRKGEGEGVLGRILIWDSALIFRYV